MTFEHLFSNPSLPKKKKEKDFWNIIYQPEFLKKKKKKEKELHTKVLFMFCQP